jgi:hypothetical protein
VLQKELYGDAQILGGGGEKKKYLKKSSAPFS